MPPGKLTIVLTLTLILTLFTSAFAATEKVLYSFTGGDDGDEPYAGVIFDSAGNLYGTTQFGGAHGAGVVFELSPSPSGWTEKVLYTFTGGTDGILPLGGVVFDASGNLYGTAAEGGDPNCQCGVVFKLTPTGNTWTFAVLHAFTGGNDGALPAGGLIVGSQIVGTTVSGGAFGCGTAFELPLSGGSNWVHPLSGNNGCQPWASLAGGAATTFNGGKYSAGNVFELSWGHHVKALHVFNPAKPLGYYPVGPLLRDSHFNLYGTTSAGGAHGGGAVFAMFYANGRYKPVALHGFSGSDGGGSASGLIMDAAGNLYGTTVNGGADPGYDGVVFKLTPGPKNVWPETILYSFTGGVDGGAPYGTIVADNAGNLYGTGIHGGDHGAGVIFEVVP